MDDMILIGDHAEQTLDQSWSRMFSPAAP